MKGEFGGVGVMHRLGPRPRRVLGAQPAEQHSDPLADVGRCKPRRGPAWGSVPQRTEGAGPGGAGPEPARGGAWRRASRLWGLR